MSNVDGEMENLAGDGDSECEEMNTERTAYW